MIPKGGNSSAKKSSVRVGEVISREDVVVEVVADKVVDVVEEWKFWKSLPVF